MSDRDPFTQKFTSSQILSKLREREPRLKDVDDQKLMQWAIQKNPDLKKYVMDASPTGSGSSFESQPEMFTSKWWKELFQDSKANFLDDLPAAGAMTGAALTSETGPGAIGGAGLGAGVGSLAKHALKPAFFPTEKGWEQDSIGDVGKDVSADMLINGLLESASRASTALPRSVAGKVDPAFAKGPFAKGAAMDNQEIAKISKDFKLPLTYAQRVPGPVAKHLQLEAEGLPISREVMEEGRNKTGRAASKVFEEKTDKALGPAVDSAKSPNIAGKQVQEEIKGTSSKLFDEQVGKLRSELSIYTRGLKAKPALINDLKKNALDDLGQSAQMSDRLIDRTNFPKDDLEISKLSPGAKKILDDIAKLKSDAPIDDLIGLRSRLMKITPETTELMSKEAPATAKHYVQKLTEIIDQSLGNSPAGQAWNKFRNFTRKGSEIFEAVQGPALLDKDPEKVADFVGTQDITKAMQLRRAVNSYTQRLGDPAQKTHAQQSWNKFRAMWFNKNIGQGSIFELGDRMKNIDPKVLNVIMGSDPEGKVLLNNLNRLSTALDRVGSKMAPGQARRWYSTIQGIMFLPVTKTIQSQAATDRIIKWSLFIAKHPEMSPANAARILQMMSGSETPNRNATKEELTK